MIMTSHVSADREVPRHQMHFLSVHSMTCTVHGASSNVVGATFRTSGMSRREICQLLVSSTCSSFKKHFFQEAHRTLATHRTLHIARVVQSYDHTSRIDMGQVIGTVGVETPRHEVLKRVTAASSSSSPSIAYEIRRYARQLRADVEVSNDEVVTATGADGSTATTTSDASSPATSTANGAAFRLLAGYIFGGNSGTTDAASTKIAMTAPVLTSTTSTKIAMTAPVLTSSQGDANTTLRMSFLLPAQYTTLAQLPKPNDPRIQLAEQPERTLAVTTFTGSAGVDEVREKGRALMEALAEDRDVRVVDSKAVPVLARYNPPWTLPMFRTNELWLEVEWLGESTASAASAASTASAANEAGAAQQ